MEIGFMCYRSMAGPLLSGYKTIFISLLYYRVKLYKIPVLAYPSGFCI